MSLKLTNKSGGQIVCDLKVAKGEKPKTLRLNNKQSKTILDTEVTKHIETLVSKGLLLAEVPKQQTKKESAIRGSKEKEE